MKARMVLFAIGSVDNRGAARNGFVWCRFNELTAVDSPFLIYKKVIINDKKVNQGHFFLNFNTFL